MKFFKLFILLIIIFIILLFGSIVFSPKPDLLTGRQFSNAFYATENKLLRLSLTSDEKYRLYTPLSAIPQHLIDATLLQEDQYFYQHPGFNPLALLRASFQTYVLQSRRMGASTITMQVARMRFNIPSHTISGKIQQIYKALLLERHYSKADILEAYFNLAPYGGNIEGVGSASIIWFNQKITDINLPQALLLAVIPQNPSLRRPDYPKLITIRNRLYDRWISLHPEDADIMSTMQLPIDIKNLKNLPFLAPHFVNTILQKKPAGIIHTTLDKPLQIIAEKVIKNYLQRHQHLGIQNAAILLVDTRDMGVKAMVGSGDFFNTSIAGQINGTDIKRSPGSSLKPFIYALAIDQGLIHPRTVLKDVPRSFGSYNPENFDRDFMGPVSAEEALTLSRNIPAIYLANLLSPNNNLYTLLEKSQVKNLKSASFYGLSLTLGGAEITMQELTALYAMLANYGVYKPLRMQTNTPEIPGSRLMSNEAAWLVLDMLKKTTQDAAQSPIAYKTGTSSGYRDAWTAGIFGPYVLTVWVGNFDNSSNHAFIGKEIAAPLFFQYIQAIKQEKGKLPSLPQEPLNLTKIEVCKASGLLPTDHCTDRIKTWFIPGKSPIKKDTIYREIAINMKTGLRTCQVDENTEFAVYEFWPSDILKIFKKAGIHRKTPPLFEAGCDRLSTSSMAPYITSPQKELTYIARADNNQANTIPFAATTDGDVKTLLWFINDRFVAKTTPDQPFLWTAEAGKYTIRVVDDHGQSDVRSLLVTVEQ